MQTTTKPLSKKAQARQNAIEAYFNTIAAGGDGWTAYDAAEKAARDARSRNIRGDVAAAIESYVETTDERTKLAHNVAYYRTLNAHAHARRATLGGPTYDEQLAEAESKLAAYDAANSTPAATEIEIDPDQAAIDAARAAYFNACAEGADEETAEAAAREAAQLAGSPDADRDVAAAIEHYIDHTPELTKLAHSDARYRDEPAAPQTAAEAYRAAFATVEQHLATVETELAAHQLAQAATPRDWTHAGDLIHTERALRTILEWLLDQQLAAPTLDPANAALAYEQARHSIDQRLAAIKTALTGHQQRQAAKPTYWTHAGDLSAIANDLLDLIRFFQN